MPEWMVGLNMAWFTLPILVGCVCLFAAIKYLDHRDKVKSGGDMEVSA